MKNIDYIVEKLKTEAGDAAAHQLQMAYRKRAEEEVKEKGYFTVSPLASQEREYPLGIVIHHQPKKKPVLMHNHDYFELVYIYRGSCVNTCAGVQTILQEDDLLLMNPNAIHCMETFSDKDVVFNFLIPQELFKQSFLSLLSDNLISNFIINYFYQVQKTVDFIIINRDAHCPLYAIIQGLIEEYFLKQPGFERILEIGMAQVFLYMSRLIAKQYSSAEWVPSSNFLSSILLYIYKNYASVTLKDVAYTFGYSEKYISRVMKKELHTGFSQITRELRLNHAAQYLEKTDMSIEQISIAVGYQNVSHFYTLFREKYGVSPLEYRQAHDRQAQTDESQRQSDDPQDDEFQAGKCTVN